MRRGMRHALLGLAIGAISLAVVTPARAQVYKNYKDENYCLGVAGAVMKNETRLITWPCSTPPTIPPDENWSYWPVWQGAGQLWVYGWGMGGEYNRYS